MRWEELKYKVTLLQCKTSVFKTNPELINSQSMWGGEGMLCLEMVRAKLKPQSQESQKAEVTIHTCT